MLFVAFWGSAGASFAWAFWPRTTWIVVLGSIVLSTIGNLFMPHSTTMAGTVTQLVGTWPLGLAALAGFAWGRVVAYGVRQDWRRTRRG